MSINLGLKPNKKTSDQLSLGLRALKIKEIPNFKSLGLDYVGHKKKKRRK